MTTLPATRFDALVEHFILPGAGPVTIGKPAQRKPDIGSTRLPFAIIGKGIEHSNQIRVPGAFDAERFGLNGRRGGRKSAWDIKTELEEELGKKLPKDWEKITAAIKDRPDLLKIIKDAGYIN